ncbi:DUF1801 domain-containing protein [Agaribacterium sp. ZY112]|uniref:DUF1801 domain-containing protein n=1 Tax=Agaribacterium sp. ZY112 TaxID=3233574 RepID=UPI0035256EE7
MDDKVQAKFETYPTKAKTQLLKIRSTTLELAKKEKLGEVVESLKWGEPSYQTKHGSTLRIDWKEKSPNSISIYVNCKTKLIETYKELYPDTFHYIGQREIALPISGPLPLRELKVCISLCLRYHKIKHLPLLGE